MTGVDMKTLGKDADYLAPDGSEIRLLAETRGGGLCHCTLPASRVSRPVAHGTVEEIWYFLEGAGQVWRKLGDQAGVVEVGPGTSLTIPPGTAFQFRNTGASPLRFIIATIPPWPEPDEAVPAKGFWT